jgi:hypothetical protein
MGCNMCKSSPVRFIMVGYERIWLCRIHFEDFHDGLVEILQVAGQTKLRRIAVDPRIPDQFRKGLKKRNAERRTQLDQPSVL